MKPLKYLFLIVLSILLIKTSNALTLNKLELPNGFSIDVYAEVPGARSLALGDNDIVFAGTLSRSKVYAIVPNKDRTKAEKVIEIADDLTMPNGVAYHKGALYVAEMNRIIRFDNIVKHLEQPPTPIVISDKLPDKKHHGWRYLRVGPDNKLYISIGAPCNVCLSDDDRFGTIMRMNLDGSQPEIIAKGIRNSVGFAWQPETQQLWFTDNGRDLLGDNIPPDELNRITANNQHFGFPYFYGQNVPDPYFGRLAPHQEYVKPMLDLPAHVAALGMTFYTGDLFPKSYQNQIFIAEHGSWNRSHKIGYQVILVTQNGDKVQWQPFVSGWLQGEKAWGRPVDLLVMRDGSLLISDDANGAIYRVTYRKANT